MNVPEFLWQQLLDLKQDVENNIFNKLDIGYNIQQGFFDAQNGTTLSYHFHSSLEANRITNGAIQEILKQKLYLSAASTADKTITQSLKLYVPLAIASLLIHSTPFVITHQAQSIDGKIATNGGSSKWIGNHANLVHAHRIRALVDAVLVGTNTVLNDSPRLNVRHVKGKNPIRVVLSNSIQDFSMLPVVDNMQTFLLRAETNQWQGDTNVINKTIYYKDDFPKTRMRNILLELKQNGIQSILIEGGSKTISSFLDENCVDWMQLHIAPLLFGSGIPCVSLGNITEVNESRRLNNVFFTQIDEAVMITGEPT